mgnify:CR=1 FL=1
MTPLVAVAGRTGAPSKVSRDEVAFAGKRYLHSLLRAGGEPVVIAPQQLADDAARELMGRFDALVLMGGSDVDPLLYGQQASPRVYGVSPQQDQFESALLRAAIAVELPVLAVCRGMQLANVVLGGTLVQHLADASNAGSLIAHAPGEFPDRTGAPADSAIDNSNRAPAKPRRNPLEEDENGSIFRPEIGRAHV